jgi:hypothetical protein
LEFLDENCQILEPVAIALDRLQGEKNSLYADLFPTLLTVSSHLSTLHSVNLRDCLHLLNAVTSGFNHRFADFLQLSPEVNMAILATINHPYFKMRSLPVTEWPTQSLALFLYQRLTVSHSLLL